MKGFNLGTQAAGSSTGSNRGSAEHPFTLGPKSKTCAQFNVADGLAEELAKKTASPISKLVHMARTVGGKRVASRKRWGTLVDAARDKASIKKTASEVEQEPSFDESTEARRRKFREKRIPVNASSPDKDQPEQPLQDSTAGDEQCTEPDSSSSSTVAASDTGQRLQLRRTSSEPSPFDVAKAFRESENKERSHSKIDEEMEPETLSAPVSDQGRTAGFFFDEPRENVDQPGISLEHRRCDRSSSGTSKTGSEGGSSASASGCTPSSREPLIATAVAAPYNRRPNGNALRNSPSATSKDEIETETRQEASNPLTIHWKDPP